MSYTNELDWSAPNPRDGRYWQAIGDALRCRRISDLNVQGEFNAAPGLPFIQSEVARVVYAISSTVSSNRWRDADGQPLFVCTDEHQVRTPAVEDIWQYLGTGHYVSNYGEFLTRAYTAILALRREAVTFRQKGYWYRNNQSMGQHTGGTLALALAHVDSEGGLDYTPLGSTKSTLSCYITADWAHRIDAFIVRGAYIPDAVYLNPKLNAAGTLYLKVTPTAPSQYEHASFDAFNSGFSEGVQEVATDTHAQVILPTTGVYRPPSTFGDTTEYGPTTRYGFDLTGWIDYGDTLIFEPLDTGDTGDPG